MISLERSMIERSIVLAEDGRRGFLFFVDCLTFYLHPRVHSLTHTHRIRIGIQQRRSYWIPKRNISFLL